MPRPINHTPVLSPGQAQYVIERLLQDRRIAHRDVMRYVADIQDEIAQIERRLADLRAASGGTAPPRRPERSSPARTLSAVTPERGRRKRRGNKLAGSYMGYMRQVPEARKAKYQAIKQDKGYEAAIAALKADLGK